MTSRGTGGNDSPKRRVGKDSPKGHVGRRGRKEKPRGSGKPRSASEDGSSGAGSSGAPKGGRGRRSDDKGRPKGSGRPAGRPSSKREERPSQDDRQPASMRLLAARELDALAARDSYIGLQAATRTGNPDKDRSIRDTVAGVLRWQRYLDFLISHFYRGDADTLEPAMRTVLRIGLYGLLFSRQPDHAVLNETVEASKIHVREGAAGLTNGVLRTVIRQRESLPEPEGPTDHRLAVRHSHPTWMVKRWLAQWGEEETIALLEHDNQRPQYGIHLVDSSAGSKAALKAADIPFEVSTWMPDMIRMHSLQPIIRGGWLEDGRAFVQDEGAALVVAFTAPEEGHRILDLCAAPGGKTMQLALRAGASGSVLACDLQENRLKLVTENADRLRLPNVSVSARDAREPAPEWLDAFDTVLLDAPCSGLGVLSKRADMRWRRSPEEIEEMILLQRELMDAAARCVRPGGVLVYSTCTTEPGENDMQVDAFLERHAEFEREAAPDGFPDEWITPKGDYLSLPHRTGMDGAYAARLRRKA